MNDRNSVPRSGIARPKTRGYLILLALLLLLFAALALGPRLAAGLRSNAQPNGMVAVSSAVENTRLDFHYFRSGQWLADVRTLVAACRYLLEPEPA